MITLHIAYTCINQVFCTRNDTNKDYKGNNHMLLTKELCYLPLLKELRDLGATSFKIEGCNYDSKTLKHIIKTYQKAMKKVGFVL